MIEPGRKVKLHYIFKVDGEMVDNTSKKGPFEFECGKSNLIPGFEKNIRGLKTGEKKSFAIQPEDAFGPANPDAIVPTQRDKLPPGEIQVGMIFSTAGKGGKTLKGRVTSIEGDQIILDFNHPIAGKVLHFEVKVIDVI